MRKYRNDVLKHPLLLAWAGVYDYREGTETGTMLEVYTLRRPRKYNSYICRPCRPGARPLVLCGLYSVRGATRANDNAQVV